MRFPEPLYQEVQREACDTFGILPTFPFAAWARATGFKYPDAAHSFLVRCGSAAEAFFARPFTERPGVRFPADKGVAIYGTQTLQLQVPAGRYRIDALVSENRLRLAIEIDGLPFHHASQAQVATDYQRQRKIVAQGFVVVRFTAGEVFRDAKKCWQDVEAILASRRPR